MKKHSILLIGALFLLIASLFFYSCTSNELTRSKAEQLIKEKMHYPREMPFQVCTTRVSVSNAVRYADRITYYNDYFNQLQAQGLITYRTDLSIDPGFTVFIAEFTKKGKPFVIGETKVKYSGAGDKYFNVKTGSFVFGEITGIIERKALNIAEVQFTELSELTPFGQMTTAQQSFNRSENFTKYDDGWRINR